MAELLTEPWNVDLERHVNKALRVIRNGTITLVIQDTRVIQIDKSEKIPLNRQVHIPLIPRSVLHFMGGGH
jgi:hypothetical protein